MSYATTDIRNSPPASGHGQHWVDLVQAKVEALRYGVVQIIVHDGKVTQIEHTEKTRLVSSREH